MQKDLKTKYREFGAIVELWKMMENCSLKKGLCRSGYGNCLCQV